MQWKNHFASLLIAATERQCSRSQYFKKNEVCAYDVSNAEIYILEKWCTLVINLSFRVQSIPTEVKD
jgi:hypothetical protein